tara:strand:- start:1046 stop:1522 length:477 start_codon:yes stop_codon:yes gene_type:complete
MKFFKLMGLFIISFICLVSCALVNIAKAHSVEGVDAIKLCQVYIQSQTGEAISERIDRAYVDVFSGGMIVAFTEGEVGTFGKRENHYRQYWACAVSENTIVRVSAPSHDPLIDKPELMGFEKYDGSVIEQLYRRENDQFVYCCEQKLDENNFEKHNYN